jgi:hypothetical protein
LDSEGVNCHEKEATEGKRGRKKERKWWIDADERFKQRNLPAKGFRPGVLLLGMGAIMGYGWYKLIVGIREAKYVFDTRPICIKVCDQQKENTDERLFPTVNSHARRCGLAFT